MNLEALTDAELNRQADELYDAAEKLSDDNVFKAQVLCMQHELLAEIARRDEERKAKEEAEQAAWDKAHEDDLMIAIFGENWNAPADSAA